MLSHRLFTRHEAESSNRALVSPLGGWPISGPNRQRSYNPGEGHGLGQSLDFASTTDTNIQDPQHKSVVIYVVNLYAALIRKSPSYHVHSHTD